MPWIECEDMGNLTYSDQEYQRVCKSLSALFERLSEREFSEGNRKELYYLLSLELALRPKVWNVK